MSKPRAVVLDGHTLNPGDLDWSGLGELVDLEVHDRTAVSDPGEILRRIGDAEVVLTNKTPLSRETLAAAPNLAFVSVLATGYNVVDTAAAGELGIEVSNVPAYGTATVAQAAIALLLELTNAVGAHDRAVKDGRWAAGPDFCFWTQPLVELDHKTMGIIGYGRIGRRTSAIAQALGMRVLASGSSLPRIEPGDQARAVSREELFAKSDVIMLHCPSTPQTRGMIGAAAIAQFKPGALLVNTARGDLLVEADVAAALNSGRLAGAGLDVLSSEPPSPDNPLLSARNVIITPHCSWAAIEARQRIMDATITNVAAHLAGEPINLV